MNNPGQVGHRHHYVAQFLLRNFTHDGERLFVFNKQAVESFPASVRKVGHEHGFNDIVLPVGKIFPFEPHITTLDTEAAPVVLGLLGARQLPIRDSDDRRLLAEFIAVQHLRVPNSRKLFECLNQVCLDAFGADSDEARSAGATADYTPEQAAFESTVAMGKMVPKSMNSILSKEWMILEACAGAGDFCISDNPVAFDSENQQDVFSTNGFDVEGIEISFPLSSKITLLMLCPSKAIKYSSASPKFKSAIDGGTALLGDSGMVSLSNQLQVASSERFLYQCTDDFQYARDMLRDFPNIATGPRFLFRSRGSD